MNASHESKKPLLMSHFMHKVAKNKNNGNLGKHITVETKVKTVATRVNTLQILGTYETKVKMMAA